MLSELAKPLTEVSTTMPLWALLEVLTSDTQHISILIDEYGGVAGLVTLEDIIETLLGFEIIDELDTTTDMQELARQRWKERAANLRVMDAGEPTLRESLSHTRTEETPNR